MGVALATPHRTATEIGRDVIRSGGGAVEAALAAAVALTVVYPHQCSLGGDLVALVRDPSGDVHSYLSVGRTARDLDVGSVPVVDGRIVGRGPHTVTVPGIIGGWLAIAGARSLAEAFRSASALAERGSPVSPGLSRALEANWSIVGDDPGMASVFGRTDGSRDHLSVGELLRQPALAVTLAELAEDPDSFYRGAIAARIVAALGDQGSQLSLADFAGHQVDRSPALDYVEAGRRWWVAPPPSQGIAFLAVRAAGLLAGGTDLSRSIDASAVRDRLLADPGDNPLDLEAYLDAMRTAGRPDVVVERPSGDTVGITAMDDDGWLVSIVQSTYQTFGSGICDRGTGIVFHNRGSAFSAESGHPAALSAGRRPPHTLTPVLAEDVATTDPPELSGTTSLLAMACQGGRAQPWILAQLADRLADVDSELDSTLGADRWVIGGKDIGCSGPTILVEAAEVPLEIAAEAERRGWQAMAAGEQLDVAGHVQVVRNGRLTLEAGTDPRSDGLAIVESAS